LAVEQLGTLRVFTSTLLEQILQSPALVLRLASIKSYDEYTLYHSVNVAVISIGLGLVIGLPETLLREIAMAGMLHDVGKIAIPNTDVRGFVRDEAGRTFDPRLVRVLDLMLGQLETQAPEEGLDERSDRVSRA